MKLPLDGDEVRMTQDFEPLEPADDEADPVIACEECDELQGIINDAVSELRAISPFESELRVCNEITIPVLGV